MWIIYTFFKIYALLIRLIFKKSFQQVKKSHMLLITKGFSVFHKSTGPTTITIPFLYIFIYFKEASHEIQMSTK